MSIHVNVMPKIMHVPIKVSTYVRIQHMPIVKPQEELPYIINKLNNLGLSYKEFKKILVGRHFQCKVEVFFKEIIVDGSLGKTKQYAKYIEFQERGSLHVHSFYKCSVHKIFQMRMHTLSFFEKSMWPSGLRHYSKNRKVPSSNPTRGLAGLRDATTLRGSR